MEGAVPVTRALYVKYKMLTWKEQVDYGLSESESENDHVTTASG